MQGDTKDLDAPAHAAAQLLVSRQLVRLGRRWRVLWSLPVGRSSQDVVDLAIGPSGLFCLHSFSHPGARIRLRGEDLTVSGVRLAYVRNSRDEALRIRETLARQLPFAAPVTGLVVLVGTRRVRVLNQPLDQRVRVHTAAGARRWITSRPRVLSAEQVETAFAVSRRVTTWDPSVWS